jgi:hypothetical protein
MKMSECDCKKTVCPKHHGAFDCTSFCDICEGNTEYCTTHDEYETKQAKIYLAQYGERITEEQFDEAEELLYSFVESFPNNDSEDFSMQLIEVGNLAHMKGWNDAIKMVLDVSGSMYNEFDNPTLEELRQRIV